VRAGDRVELVHTDDQYTRLKPGDRGTVQQVLPPQGQIVNWTQVFVDWEDGSNLIMIPEAGDRLKVVS
jgi:hypothetical protein